MQRLVAVFGCIVIALIALLPPVRVMGTSTKERAFLFSDSVTSGGSRALEVEAGRLLAECLLAGALTGCAWCLAGANARAASNSSKNGASSDAPPAAPTGPPST